MIELARYTRMWVACICVERLYYLLARSWPLPFHYQTHLQCQCYIPIQIKFYSFYTNMYVVNFGCLSSCSISLLPWLLFPSQLAHSDTKHCFFHYLIVYSLYNGDHIDEMKSFYLIQNGLFKGLFTANGRWIRKRYRNVKANTNNSMKWVWAAELYVRIVGVLSIQMSIWKRICAVDSFWLP